MTKRSINFLLLGGLMAATISCAGEKEAITREATLRWTGMVAADGCGYFLDIEGTEYKPSNEEVIPESFQQEGEIPVVVTYTELEEPEEFSCGMRPTRYSSTIAIQEIEAQAQE